MFMEANPKKDKVRLSNYVPEEDDIQDWHWFFEPT
jgi:hypothetical protein